MPWAEVQSRLLTLQRSGGLCVQPRPLTELDVHHRILRYTNYQVALANKGLLPARCPLPWGGTAAFLSRGLALNVDLLLFRGPFSLFRGGWELPDAYKRSDQRAALASRWRRTVLLLAAVNLALSPLVLAWQVLHAFYSHTELLRREPGALGRAAGPAWPACSCATSTSCRTSCARAWPAPTVRPPPSCAPPRRPRPWWRCWPASSSSSPARSSPRCSCSPSTTRTCSPWSTCSPP